MATITTLNSTDSGSTSRGTINTNFTNLNTDKAELASPTFTGTVTTPAIKITTGASNGYILQSNASGNASWVANPGAITIETTTGTTHSLTTTAGQKVVVWVKGTTTGNTSITVLLQYNSVTKDTVTFTNVAANETNAFSLIYTETPGAATQNITVSGGTLADVVIIVMKIG